MASSHTSTMARVVVGVDGSAHSKLALLAAVDLAAAAGVRVHVVEAWQRPATGTKVLGEAPTAGRVRRDLEATVEETLGPNCPPDTQMSVIEGDPVAVLVHASRGALNLVVGAHDHTTTAHRSVAVDILDHAACPVTVVSGAALSP
jgi:nucleotide-binding universal stress UspA family protein